MRNIWLALLLVSVGCASAPLNKLDLAAVAQADARLREGCYDCLLEARDIYQRIAVGKARPIVLPWLFEAELLIYSREREFALDADAQASRVRAAALGNELPAAFEAARYLAIVDTIPGDQYGWSRAEQTRFAMVMAPMNPKADAESAWLRAEAPAQPAGAKPPANSPAAASLRLRQPARLYLDASLECHFIPTRRPGAQRPSAGTPTRIAPIAGSGQPAPDLFAQGLSPLVIYRQASCTRVVPPMLERLRAEIPRFVETSYALARMAVPTVKDNGGALARQQAAEVYKRFPKSTSATYLNGYLTQLIGSCKAALPFYNETIAIKPLHEDALLGRTMCLSVTMQHDAGIASATHMLEQKPNLYNFSDAYYWRAWNLHQQKKLPEARADSDRAKSLAVNPNVLTLAGVIEHDQDDLAPAEKDLLAARALPDGQFNCLAANYLGSVYFKKKAWRESAQSFEAAMHCFQFGVAQSTEGLAKMRAMKDVDPEWQAQQIKNFEVAIKEDEAQSFMAAFNAANHYAAVEDVAKVRALVEVAARAPEIADKVAILREWLKNKIE